MSGAVSTERGDVLSGVTVRFKPSTGSAPAAAKTDKTGFYAMFHVPAGYGTITISGAPTGCTTPSIPTYYVPAGTPATVNITVLCP